MKRLLTEKDVRSAAKEGRHHLRLERDTVVTPGAVDAARQLGVVIVQSEVEYVHLAGLSRREGKRGPVIAVGSDHAGFGLKKRVKEFLEAEGYDVLDVGVFSEQSADYPDMALLVAQHVSRRRAWRGIVVDGAGIGSAIVANKLPGVRAAPCHSVETARSSREHNNANVLALGARITSEADALEILRVWLGTEFAGGRHLRRVKKIDSIERRYLRA